MVEPGVAQEVGDAAICDFLAEDDGGAWATIIGALQGADEPGPSIAESAAFSAPRSVRRAEHG